LIAIIPRNPFDIEAKCKCARRITFLVRDKSVIPVISLSIGVNSLLSQML